MIEDGIIACSAEYGRAGAAADDDPVIAEIGVDAHVLASAVDGIIAAARLDGHIIARVVDGIIIGGCRDHRGRIAVADVRRTDPQLLLHAAFDIRKQLALEVIEINGAASDADDRVGLVIFAHIIVADGAARQRQGIIFREADDGIVTVAARVFDDIFRQDQRDDVIACAARDGRTFHARESIVVRAAVD